LSTPAEDRASAPANVCLVVPCYNEEGRLDRAAFLDALRNQPNLFLWFVDDGSADGTTAVHTRLQANVPDRIGVLALGSNRGKGEAVRLGMLDALERLGEGVAHVGFWDADLSTPLSEAPHLQAALNSHAELVAALGSRVRLLGRDIARRPVRHYLGRVFATAASLVLRLPVYDTQCGAKLFRAGPVLREALTSPFRSRWIFDVELIARLAQAAREAGQDPEAWVHEVPLRAWTEMAGSRLRARDYLNAVRDLWVIRRTYRENESRRLAD